MDSPKLNERCTTVMANGKKMSDSLDDQENSIRESVKSERGKGEEDWRRRTIIIEKKNGSYGFTLQSYGIHYKKEQEIEVITYVDQVENEGAASSAGMREGDVILSINGHDVEHADHATIVDAISASESRMRVVVIFEDCVRKVELHMKYINIQRTIQAKMRELEQLTIKERQLYDGNWKTHSLPSQKKKNSPVDVISDVEEGFAAETINGTYCRPTMSSENVTSKPTITQQTFLYQYLDPRYGACFIQPSIRTGGFVITVGSPRTRRDCHHYVLKSANDCYHVAENRAAKHSKSHRSGHSHSCTPCMPTYNNQDSNSLEAYDLASPCCDPHCVPNSRKKSRRKKECSKKKDKGHQNIDKTQRHESCSHRKKACSSSTHCGRYRLINTESTQTSQCSLQSYAAGNAPCDNSVSSYSTSLSSDTLFWDNERSEAKSSPKIQYQSTHSHVKPKSWDNLTTKAFGGYGFGYGYSDSGKQTRSKSHSRHSNRHEYHEHRVPVYNRSHTGTHCVPTKSTESLVKYQNSGSETRLTCDCADALDFYRRQNKRSDNRSSTYYAHYVYPSHTHKKDSNISSEITRL